MQAAQFLRNLIAAVPYKLHAVLTDNGYRGIVGTINLPPKSLVRTGTLFVMLPIIA